MTTVDAGLRFWLRYVEAGGGITDPRGDSTVVMLPEAMQNTLELPEVLAVTADPDVAREDDVTLMSSGHPALGRSADEVLAVGDVAVLSVVVPATVPPAIEYLQEMARDQIAVDHGRIDATGTPTRSERTILRVGALVDYTLSSDDRYQECAECWVDVTSRRRLPDAVSAKLAGLEMRAEGGTSALAQLPAAITTADQFIEQGARQRREVLGNDIAKLRDTELARVEGYYRDALATIERRAAQANPERLAMLDARAESVRTERVRRLNETRDKYRASHRIRPYRLHLYKLPVWQLPVDVRRGDRRYPLTLDWQTPLGRFADIGCPRCNADDRLVATKKGLACVGCAPPR